MRTILIIILLLLLIGSLPVYPYNVGWGYYPFSGVVAVVIIVLVLMGRL